MRGSRYLDIIRGDVVMEKMNKKKVIIFTVLTSGIVVDEVNKGTIKQLLVTPNKRYKIF